MLPLPPLPLPPRSPQPAQWTLERLGHDKAKLIIDTTLTRHECFRLIGELERMATTL